MSIIPAGQWALEQQRRFDAYGVSRCTDIHCHCLPGLDDGPNSLDEAIDLCRALVRDGITTVIATPHQLGLYDRQNSAERIRQTVAHLSAELVRLDIPLDWREID